MAEGMLSAYLVKETLLCWVSPLPLSERGKDMLLLLLWGMDCGALVAPALSDELHFPPGLTKRKKRKRQWRSSYFINE